MFDYRVWYTISSDHAISTFIRSIAYIFKTDLFNPHISIMSCLKRSDADSEFLRTVGRAKPWFTSIGTPFQTRRDKRYIIEQRCALNGIAGLTDYYILLAYRLNAPFTDQEMQHVKSMVPTTFISASDIYVSLNDCRSSSPIHWKQVKREP